MRRSALLCMLCLITGCAVLGLPTRPRYDPTLADTLEVGQWCRVDTEQHMEGEGHTKTRYVGRVERITDQSISLTDVSIHTRKVRLFKYVPHRSSEDTEVAFEQSAMFVLPRFIITGAAQISDEEASALSRPIERIGVDFDFAADQSGNED